MGKKIIFAIVPYLLLLFGIIFYKSGALFISHILHIGYETSIYIIGVTVGLTFGAIYIISCIFETEKMKAEVKTELEEIKNIIGVDKMSFNLEENKITYKFSPEVYSELRNYLIYKEVQTLFFKKFIITDIKRDREKIVVKIREIKI